MRIEQVNKPQVSQGNKRERERGSAIVICLFILALITVFVMIAMTRSSSEALAVGNETAESRTFYAAQGSLEVMTRNFNKVFETKLNPTTADLNSIRTAGVPGLTNFTFNQELDQTSTRQNVVLSGGPYTGLYAIRDNWRLRTTATDNQGVQVQLTRNVLNSRIPIFQFGIFFEDDLELYRPPRFSFGGRVHSNRNFFVSPGANGVYFDSKVTAVGEIITQTWRNWNQSDSGNNQTYIKNASGVNTQLLPANGSVLNTTEGAANNIFSAQPDMPPSRENTAFTSSAAIFDGNLQNRVARLILPIKVGYPNDLDRLVELVKRPLNTTSGGNGDLYQDTSGNLAAVTNATQDDDIMRSERYANKPGIRISLADSKAKLPGCASGSGTAAVTGACGIRLDGNMAGDGGEPAALPSPMPTPMATVPAALQNAVRGYQPKSMKNPGDLAGVFSYKATRLNGERFYTQGSMPSGRTQEVWIKVEMVSINSATLMPESVDITQDFLSMGVTEEAPSSITLNAYSGSTAAANNGTPTAPSSNLTATTAQTATTYPDSRSIIKLQRFMMPGEAAPGGSNVIYSYGNENVVRRYTAVGSNDNNINVGCVTGCTAANLAMLTTSDTPVTSGGTADKERYAHLKRATVNGTSNVAIVPFPIKMFDGREGEYYDERSTTYYTDLSQLTRNGVMSMVDIDVANLRRFLRGDFDGLFPTDTPFALSNSNNGLRSTNVPQREGWVVYVSDRRGDADFDGELDMEDIFSSSPGNGGTLQSSEDVNQNGLLDARYWGAGSDARAETERYNTRTILPDRAAVADHKYYRRGVRLINGTVVPGIYSSSAPSNTRGFAFASENGVYVEGNYNATGVSSVPSSGNTPYDGYLPLNSATHIPASIAGDSVTVLSNAWNDGTSFESPYDARGRVASNTTIRFAMISGDTMTSRELSPHQGGLSPRLNGGVHNFKRYLESWIDQSGSNAYSNRLDYSGSLINLFNSRNNNGSFKCCNTVYDPPIRNWVFDSTFLDPSRMPPGTPFFQYVQTTGFQRTND
ncbi:MAG TPA: hypothetical protein PKA82_12650 [Pyrinomonadaceae bacterium]|nr:hypothetical protein [Pyrinomonadaceae bacterium]